MKIMLKKMFYSTRYRLIASFMVVTLLLGTISLFVGIHLLYNTILNEAINRVSLDLNTAREVYLMNIKSIRSPLIITCLGFGFKFAVRRRDVPGLIIRLENLANRAELDFIGIVTKNGNTLCSIGKGSMDTIHRKTVKIANPITDEALKNNVPVSGTFILKRDFLYAHSPELAERAYIKFVPTPESAPRMTDRETSGMAISAGIPIMENGDLLGVLYGGILLNRNQAIVDKVRDIVFQNEIYKERSIGTSTVFLDDLRISTNVVNQYGKRAIGTRVSEEVKRYVLKEGRKWTARAFVVSDWYITAYEPIEDISGNTVGMLYVGVLEEKYVDIRRETLLLFIIIILSGMILSIGLGYLLADRIISPINRLIKASHQVYAGNFTPDIGPISKSEIGILQKTFSEMIAYFQKRYNRQKSESEIRLLQSEKQASVGKLAAGVAHEINNPLTGVLTYSHMLLRRKDLADDIRSDIEVIAKSTERVRKIVKGLLDFSRQTKLESEPTDVNELVRSTVSMLQNQTFIKKLTLKFEPGEGVPMVTLDRSQLQSVIMNMVINAFDATDAGGLINVSTGVGLFGKKVEEGYQEVKGVGITITDTGCGISQENIDKLFEPFFTTKEVGYGTGLGLSVSYGIIKRHNGSILVESEVGKGSKFIIWLPVEVQNDQDKDISN